MLFHTYVGSTVMSFTLISLIVPSLFIAFLIASSTLTIFGIPPKLTVELENSLIRVNASDLGLPYLPDNNILSIVGTSIPIPITLNMLTKYFLSIFQLDVSCKSILLSAILSIPLLFLKAVITLLKFLITVSRAFLDPSSAIITPSLSYLNNPALVNNA